MIGPTEAFLAYCRPYCFPAPWTDSLATRCFGGVTDLEGTLAKLLEQFKADDLIEAGIAQANDGPLTLVPGLLGEKTAFVVDRDIDGQPTALITVHERIPLVATQANAKATALPDSCADEPLYVTDTPVNWALLTALGFRACLLAELDIESFRHSAAKPTSSSGPLASASCAAGVDAPDVLVLTGWDPSELSLRAEYLIPVIETLTEMAWHGQADLEHVSLWQPSSQVLEAVRVALRYGGIAAAGNELRTSASRDLYLPEILTPSPIAADPVLELDLALSRLELELNAEPMNRDEARLARATRMYQASVEAHIVMPLVREAMAETYPISRSQRLLLAHYARTFHCAVPLLGRIEDYGLPVPSVDDILQLGRQTISIIKRIELG